MHLDDLEGRPLFASDDVHAPIDIRLPAGTYHVIVRLGKLLRRYTVTLQHGATFDLHLPLTKGANENNPVDCINRGVHRCTVDSNVDSESR